MDSRVDTFDRANTANNIGTPSDGGSPWIQLSGTWGITSNTGYQSGASGAHCACVLNAGVAQNLTVQVTASTADVSAGLAVRATNNDNYLLAQFNGGAGTMALYKRVAGAYTQLGSTFTGTISAADVFKVTIDDANNIAFFQNGVSRVTAQDSFNSTATKHGLWSNNTSGDASRFNDFSVASTETGFPGVVKLGAKLSYTDVSGWMPAVNVSYKGPFFPRIFENDLARATLASLPAERFSVLFSTDHSSGATSGEIGRVDFDTIEGTWTDSGASIHSGANSRETPQPVFDPDNTRINVYVHDQGSTVTYGTQAARRLTTTDLATLTDQGQLLSYGHHTGYGYYQRVSSGNWRALHGFVSGSSVHHWIWTKSTSTDGVTWTKGATFHEKLAQLAPSGYVFSAESSWFTFDGQEYLLSLLFNPASGVSDAIVAIPVASDGVSPNGGYYTLIETGSGADPDAGGIRGLGQAFDVDGTLYIIYSGINSSNELSICLAKESTGLSVRATPNWPMMTNGDLLRDTASTTHVNWNAISDGLPASITKVLSAGTDNSSHVAASYYELKTGSGAQQTLYLRTADTFDPALYETVECEWTVLSQDVLNAETERRFILSFVDSYSTINGLSIVWGPSGGSDDRIAGEALIYNNNVNVASEGTKSLAYASTNETAGQFCRNTRFRLKLRIHDYGARASFFVDGSCAWHRNVQTDSIAYGTGGFFALRLETANTHPQIYARLEQVAVTSYLGAAPGGSGALLLSILEIL